MILKNFITYFVRLTLIAEKRRNRRFASIEYYMMPFLALLIINSAILGSLMLLAVRLTPLQPSYARENLVNPTIVFLFALPILLIYYYRKGIDLDMLREEIDSYDDKQLKRKQTIGIILFMLCSSSILIALSILSLLIKFNII